jgi:glutathione S-transferase
LADKYQGTKNSTILIPADKQKAALVEQFISVESNNFKDPITKIILEIIIKPFYGAAPDEGVIKESREKMNNVLDIYEKLLEGKNYIAGEFSLADILHCPFMQYGIKAGHGDLWNDPKRPNVARWWKNISERESWKNTVAEDPLK